MVAVSAEYKYSKFLLYIFNANIFLMAGLPEKMILIADRQLNIRIEILPLHIFRGY